MPSHPRSGSRCDERGPTRARAITTAVTFAAALAALVGCVEATEDDDDAPLAVAGVTPDRGELPLTVRCSAAGSRAAGGLATARWTLGDGDAADGIEIEHVYVRAGTFEVTLTITDAAGREATDVATVDVAPASCPTAGAATSGGAVVPADLDEISGVVESRRAPGVLWVHNDSGDLPRLYAIGVDGVELGRFSLDGAPAGDWEDLALHHDDAQGGWTLFVGDIGDNPRSRDTIRVLMVPEPEVTPGQAPVDEVVPFTLLELDYPDERSLDAEALVVDPRTGDLIVLTKDYGEPSEIYRKPPPHLHGERVELELVTTLDLEPFGGGTPTGADLAPEGARLVLRTYHSTAYLWPWDRGVGLAEALAAEPCPLALPVEPQGEAIGFTADGTGLWSISERESQPVYRVPLEPGSR